MDNYDRGIFGKYAIQAGVKDAHNLIPSEQLTDVLANLMHYANLEALDFESALNSARMHFEAEKES